MCILLVEDEPFIRMATEALLEDAGYEVLAAWNGQQAYEYLDNHPGRFTCLVTDYQMPGDITGGHVIRYIRPIYPVIPMILTSAYPHIATPEWRARYEVELLVKPYDPDDLVRMVGRLLH